MLEKYAAYFLYRRIRRSRFKCKLGSIVNEGSNAYPGKPTVHQWECAVM